MEPVDLDLDERLRRLAAPRDPDAVDRVTRAALAAGKAGRLFPRAAVLSLIVVVVAAGLLWTTRRPESDPSSETAGAEVFGAMESTVELGAGDVVSLTGPDGTTTIISVPGRRSSVPPGMGYVISVGGAR
jgi:hypothetical protein